MIELNKIPELSREVFSQQVEEEGGIAPMVKLSALSDELQDTIKDIVAYQLSGRTPEDIAGKLGVDIGYDRTLESQYPAHFARERKEQLARMETETRMNLLGIRAALTREAFGAIRVLAEIMNDDSAAAGVRAKAARDILNLVGAGYSGQNDSVNKAAAVVINNFPELKVESDRIHSVDGEVIE